MSLLEHSSLDFVHRIIDYGVFDPSQISVDLNLYIYDKIDSTTHANCLVLEKLHDNAILSPNEFLNSSVTLLLPTLSELKDRLLFIEAEKKIFRFSLIMSFNLMNLEHKVVLENSYLLNSRPNDRELEFLVWTKIEKNKKEYDNEIQRVLKNLRLKRFLRLLED